MSFTLPHWLQRWLGDQPGPGEGTVWTLEHHWGWPPGMTLLVLALAAALVVMIYLREGRSTAAWYRILLAALRLSVMGVVLLMVAQLALSRQRTGLPYVAVLVDDSLSMTIVDRYDEKLRAVLEQRIRKAGLHAASQHDLKPSRWNLARTLLCENHAQMLSTIGDQYKLRVYYLTGVRSSNATGTAELSEEILGLRATGETSRLGAAVQTVLDDLRGTDPAAVVLLTDGIKTDGPSLDDAAALARRRGVPLFLVGLGSDLPSKDLKLSDLLVDRLVFLDDVVSFEVNLTGTGFAGKQVDVMLREEGKQDVLAKVAVTVGPDGQPQPVRLPYRPTAVGEFRYALEVEPQAGELQADNNRQTCTVEVRKEKIRVLLAQAYPSYEFRYLRETLRRDETIELCMVLQEADPEYTQQDPAVLPVFPVGREELLAYDVIILGDLSPALLSASILQHLVDFVDQPGKGGALVLIAGPEFMPAAFRDTPLERLIPVNIATVRYPDPNQVITQGFTVQPTEIGWVSPPMQLGDTPEQTREIWRNLPPLYWRLEIPDVKPGTRVLAEDPTRLGPDGRPMPVICLRFVGAGKTLFHATDETWRWRRRVGDRYFARYWIQTIRYLSRSKLAESGGLVLSSDRAEYVLGETVRLRAQFLDQRLAPAEDDGVTVMVEQPGQQSRRLQLRRAGTARGVFEGALGGLPVGSYHAWVAIPTSAARAPSVDLKVVAPAGEFEHVQAETAAMRRAAEATRGRYYTFQTTDRLLRDLPPGRQVPIGLVTRRPLWNTWPVLLLFLVLLIGEWILRKLRGMV